MDYKRLSKKDEHGKGPCFVDIIKQSINYDKSLKKLFDNDDSKIEEFAKKTKNHRNLFSHAKHKSERFEGIENKYAAMKLYTILRFIIPKINRSGMATVPTVWLVSLHVQAKQLNTKMLLKTATATT